MIYVSIGHHAEAKGASFGDFNEYDEATIWANLLVAMLADSSLLVPPGALKTKVEYVNNQSDAVVALEIHFNSAKKTIVNAAGANEEINVGSGSETLYCPNSIPGFKLATAVQKELGRVFKPDRGVKEGWYRMNPKFGPDFFLVQTKIPSVIVEPEFIHRKETIINSREEGCYAIARGLQNYLEGENKNV